MCGGPPANYDGYTAIEEWENLNEKDRDDLSKMVSAAVRDSARALTVEEVHILLPQGRFSLDLVGLELDTQAEECKTVVHVDNETYSSPGLEL